MSAQPAPERPKTKTAKAGSRDVHRGKAAHELFIAFVGPVGAGSSHVARQLERHLKTTKLKDDRFTCKILKAGDVIRDWVSASGRALPSGLSQIDLKIEMQVCGDKMREERVDSAAVAVDLIEQIAVARASAKKESFTEGQPVLPEATLACPPDWYHSLVYIRRALTEGTIRP